MKKKRRQRRVTKRSPPCHDRDRVIYSTIRPPLNTNLGHFNNNHLETIPEEFSRTQFDAISTSSFDLDNITRDPNFQKEPMAYLQRLGATEFELQTLMKHPNFINDPLAALRIPAKTDKQITKVEQTPVSTPQGTELRHIAGDEIKSTSSNGSKLDPE